MQIAMYIAGLFSLVSTLFVAEPQPVTDPDLPVATTSDRNLNLVRLDFGRPLAWLYMGPDQARDVALEILRAASELDGKIVAVEIWT